MINKNISDDEGFAKLSAPAAVLFCLLIPHYNSHGKQNGGPGYIKDEICPRVPYLTVDNLPGYLKEISDNTSVKWFEFNGRRWIHSLKFLSDHQKLEVSKLGEDKLPDYSTTSPRLLDDYSTTSRKQVVHEVEVEVEEKAKGSRRLEEPVDNSEPEYPPFDSVTPEKEKAALKEKTKKLEEKNSPPGDDNKELRDLMAKVKTKYPKMPIDTWYGKNMRAHPLAIIHVLKSLLKNGDGLASEDPPLLLAYIQTALNVEIGKYNARDSESEHEIRKKPIPGEMQTIGKILAQVGA